MDNNALSIGMDFGTTNSAMVWYNPGREQVEILTNVEGENTTPSLVYPDEEEIADAPFRFDYH